MNDYYFQCREFGISGNGIHLLRSGYNYATIEFSQLDSLTIERGKELHNWVAILVIGFGLLAFAGYYSLGLLDIFGGSDVKVIYIEEILVPLGPLLLGSYCVYSSLRRCTVLRIRTIDDKVNKLSLREFEKQEKIGPLKDFLKEKLLTKVRINV